MSLMIFGGIFAFCGVLPALILIIVAITSGELFLIAIALIFIAVFGGIGFFFFNMGYKDYKHRRDLIKNGARFLATIIDYEDNNALYVNGSPLLDLIVLFDMYGSKQIARIATNTTEESRYPINSSVEVAVLNHEIVLVK